MPSVRCPMDLSSSYSKSTAQRGTQPPRSKDPRSRVPSEAGAVAAGCLRYASGGFKTMAEQSLKRNHLSGDGRLSTNTVRTMIMYCNLKNMVLLRVPTTRLYPLPKPFYSRHTDMSQAFQMPGRARRAKVLSCPFTAEAWRFAKLFLVI